MKWPCAVPWPWWPSIGPAGILYKYRKVNTWIPYEVHSSPHDLEGYDEPLFPVVDTPIGRIVCAICYDWLFPEAIRQLAANGAEVLVHVSAYGSLGATEPMNWWSLVNRCRALENMAYVVASNQGASLQHYPPYPWPGGSQVVDFDGRLLAEASPGPGERIVVAPIDISALRHERETRRGHHMLAHPYTDEFTGGLDHELFPALRLSLNYTHRSERNPQATSNPANPYDTFLTTRPDNGRDGVAGTSDDSTFQFYNRTSTAVNQTFFTNDRNYRQTYDGIEITATKRMSDRWQMVTGYTYAQSRVEGLSVNTNPNTLINVTGPLAGQNTNFNGQIGDRPHQFKLTGTYVLPVWDIGLAGNFSSLSGVAITRQVSVAQTVGGNSTVNVEPLGSYRLPRRTVADLRVFKTTNFGSRSLEASVDFNNVSNANTFWDARTLSGTINLRQNGDPAAINTLPQFGSPAQVYGPRNIRFNLAFRF